MGQHFWSEDICILTVEVEMRRSSREYIRHQEAETVRSISLKLM